jgi:hypothetical protein
MRLEQWRVRYRYPFHINRNYRSRSARLWRDCKKIVARTNRKPTCTCVRDLVVERFSAGPLKLDLKEDVRPGFTPAENDEPIAGQVRPILPSLRVWEANRPCIRPGRLLCYRDFGQDSDEGRQYDCKDHNRDPDESNRVLPVAVQSRVTPATCRPCTRQNHPCRADRSQSTCRIGWWLGDLWRRCFHAIGTCSAE